MLVKPPPVVLGTRVNPIEHYMQNITRYHIFVFCLIFPCKAPTFWHVLNLIFLSPPMHFYCNGTIAKETKDVCPCDDPMWDLSVFTQTMQTKFNLNCEKSWNTHFSHSISYLGALFGSLSLGFLSDKFGRLTIFSFSCLTVAVSGCLVTVMPTIAAFTTMRFIEGTGVGGCIVTSYVLIIEYCSSHHRETVTALFHIPITMGHIILPGISYLLRDMDDFQLAISIPMFLFVPIKWLIMESPLWLMDNDRIDQLVDGLNIIHPNSVHNIRDDLQSYRESRRARHREKVKLWQIFNHRRLSINFACMSVNYFVCGMGYYGVSQFIGAMAGDIHQNVAISGFLLLPGAISSVFLLKIFSRRYFLMTCNIMSGIFMLAAIGTPEHINWLRVVFACIANCFFFVIFILVFLYSVELFPTSIRNSVLGVLSTLSRIGQVITPPINALKSETAAGAIFGSMAILGAIACVPLPETKNINLPSSVIDIKVLKNNKFSPNGALSDNIEASSS